MMQGVHSTAEPAPSRPRYDLVHLPTTCLQHPITQKPHYQLDSGVFYILRGFVWWPGAESNHRHKDFQSSALPTELPGQSARV